MALGLGFGQFGVILGFDLFLGLCRDEFAIRCAWARGGIECLEGLRCGLNGVFARDSRFRCHCGLGGVSHLSPIVRAPWGGSVAGVSRECRELVAKGFQVPQLVPQAVALAW